MLVPLLQKVAHRGVAPDFLGKVLSVSDAQKGQVPSNLPERLSDREVEALRLVKAGLSNREIAQKLVISTGTAKTHVHNLCEKIGVRNRIGAAAKANDLNPV